MRSEPEAPTRSANGQGDRVSNSQETPGGAPDTLIRTMDGCITAWSPGMEQRYGYTSSEALGHRSYHLLRTIFPESSRDIEASLASQDRWSGVLLHRHADGSAVVTANHWYVHRDTGEQAGLVTEEHSNIAQESKDVRHQFAEMLAVLVHDLAQPLTAVSIYVEGARRILEGGQMDLANLDLANLRQAMVQASDQMAKGAEIVHLLRDLAAAMGEAG